MKLRSFVVNNGFVVSHFVKIIEERKKMTPHVLQLVVNDCTVVAGTPYISSKCSENADSSNIVLSLPVTVLVIALFGHAGLCFMTCEAQPIMAHP